MTLVSHLLIQIVHCLGIMALLAFLHLKHILGTFMGHWMKDVANETLWSYSTNSFIHFQSIQIVHDLPWWQLHKYFGNVVCTLEGMA